MLDLVFALVVVLLAVGALIADLRIELACWQATAQRVAIMLLGLVWMMLNPFGVGGLATLVAAIWLLIAMRIQRRRQDRARRAPDPLASL
ncbi:MAG: hypothetical protein Q4G40_10770 [Brachybacterium sp.]|nr:hypothetical protein [Brachybacterium sp.]